MKTIEILSEMNIHFDEATDSLFDYILGCKKITTLDMFPKVIHNSRKYQSVEVFYQRVLDRKMIFLAYKSITQLRYTKPSCVQI